MFIGLSALKSSFAKTIEGAAQERGGRPLSHVLTLALRRRARFLLPQFHTPAWWRGRDVPVVRAVFWTGVHQAYMREHELFGD